MSLFLGDRENTSDEDCSGWHHNDVAKRRVLVAPFELQIATAQYDIVSVLIRVLSKEPQPDLAADHVVADEPLGNLVLWICAPGRTRTYDRQIETDHDQQ
jgi:hypothetical protein